MLEDHPGTSKAPKAQTQRVQEHLQCDSGSHPRFSCGMQPPPSPKCAPAGPGKGAGVSRLRLRRRDAKCQNISNH